MDSFPVSAWGVRFGETGAWWCALAGMGGPTTGSSRPFSNRAIAGRYQSAQELSEAGSDRDAKEHGFFSPPHRRHSRCAMFPCRATGTDRKPFGRRDSTRPIPERLAIFSGTASLGGIFVNLLTSCRADHRRLSRHTRRLKVTWMFRLDGVCYERTGAEGEHQREL